MDFVISIIVCCLRVFRRVLVDKNILDVRSYEYKRLETYFTTIEHRMEYLDKEE